MEIPLQCKPRPNIRKLYLGEDDRESKTKAIGDDEGDSRMPADMATSSAAAAGHLTPDIVGEHMTRTTASGSGSLGRDANGGALLWATETKNKYVITSGDVDGLRRGPAASSDDERVVLNVGGERFQTTVTTLRAVPGSRLARLSPTDAARDVTSGEYFFDRNPRYFAHILDYHRQGELHMPQCACAPAIKRELTYWGIAMDQLSPCCLRRYTDYERAVCTIAEIQQAFSSEATTALLAEANTPAGRCRRWCPWLPCSWLHHAKTRLWLFLQHPDSSKPAKIWAHFFVLMLLTSVMVMCFDTLPSFRVPTQHRGYQMNASFNLSRISHNPKLTMYLTSLQHPALYYINHLCTVFFAAELLVRFAVCPAKLHFFKSFFNLVDIIAVMPTFAASLVTLINFKLWLQNNLRANYIIFTLTSIFRAIRMVKLVRHYRGLRVMFLALKASAQEMLLLILLLTIGVLIFSTTIYFVELRSPDTFSSIPIGCWWSLVTMTTVGYGDNIPKTAGGYVVGAVCAVCGMLITGLPIPVMASNFNHYNCCAKVNEKLEERRKRERKGETVKIMPFTQSKKHEDLDYGPPKLEIRKS